MMSRQPQSVQMERTHTGGLGILPFDHDRQMASVLAIDGKGQRVLVTKGAPESVLSRCSRYPSVLNGRWMASSPKAPGSSRSRLAKWRNVAPEPVIGDETRSTLRGYLVFADRPSSMQVPQSPSSVDSESTPKIITGDNGVVAAKVCKDIGPPKASGSSPGTELDVLDDER